MKDIIYIKGLKEYYSLKYDAFILKLKGLQGDPAYIARGMALGVFIGITPTIPFHTLLAVIFSFILRGSIAAAVIGVWICNPVTALFFYTASYYSGMLIIGISPDEVHIISDIFNLLISSSLFSIRFGDISELLGDKLYILYAVFIGGVVIAIPSAIASYFITVKLLKKLNRRVSVL